MDFSFFDQCTHHVHWLEHAHTSCRMQTCVFYLVDSTYLPVFEEPGLGFQYLELHPGICQNINDIKLNAMVKFI